MLNFLTFLYGKNPTGKTGFPGLYSSFEYCSGFLAVRANLFVSTLDKYVFQNTMSICCTRLQVSIYNSAPIRQVWLSKQTKLTSLRFFASSKLCSIAFLRAVSSSSSWKSRIHDAGDKAASRKLVSLSESPETTLAYDLFAISELDSCLVS